MKLFENSINLRTRTNNKIGRFSEGIKKIKTRLVIVKVCACECSKTLGERASRTKSGQEPTMNFIEAFKIIYRESRIVRNQRRNNSKNNLARRKFKFAIERTAFNKTDH